MSQFIKAKPVWIKGYESEMNITVEVYSSFSAEPKQLSILRIAGASFYKIYLNGEFIHFGPARAGHGCVRMDEIELTKMLKAGKNHLAIEIAGYNCKSFNGIDMAPFLQTELIVDKSIIAYTGGDDFSASLQSSKKQKVMRYSFQRQFSEVYNYIEPSEISNWLTSAKKTSLELVSVPLNVKYIDREVPIPNYDIKLYKEIYNGGDAVLKADLSSVNYQASRFIDIDEDIDGFKVKDLDDRPIHRYQEYNYIINNFKQFDLEVGKFVTIDMGINNTGFIISDIMVHEDAEILITFGEFLENNLIDPTNAEQMNNIIKYSLKKNSEVYKLETFEMYGYKYISYIVLLGKIELKNCAIKEFSNPETENSIFECDDEKLMLIFEAAKNTYRQNAVDIFMDCPTRERAGWLCDSYFTAQASQIFSGNVKVEKAFLENFVYATEFSDLPKGMLPMSYPSDILKGYYIPQWAIWGLIELDQYFQRDPNADKALYKDLSYDLLNHLAKNENEDGLLEKLDNWNFVEWSKANDWVHDVNYPTNMLYSKALALVGKWYNDNMLTDKSTKIKKEIIKQSYNGDFFVDNAVRNKAGELKLTGNRSEVCQYYAYFFDVISFDDDTYASLKDTILNVFGPAREENGLLSDIEPANALMGIYMRLELLERCANYKQLIGEIRDYFYPMAEKTGTLWEHKFVSGSLNHGFASYAAVSIIKALTGLKRIDERNKTVTYGDTDCDIQCKIKIGLLDGEITFERNSDISKIQISECYNRK